MSQGQPQGRTGASLGCSRVKEIVEALRPSPSTSLVPDNQNPIVLVLGAH